MGNGVHIEVSWMVLPAVVMLLWIVSVTARRSRRHEGNPIGIDICEIRERSRSFNISTPPWSKDIIYLTPLLEPFHLAGGKNVVLLWLIQEILSGKWSIINKPTPMIRLNESFDKVSGDELMQLMIQLIDDDKRCYLEVWRNNMENHRKTIEQWMNSFKKMAEKYLQDHDLIAFYEVRRANVRRDIGLTESGDALLVQLLAYAHYLENQIDSGMTKSLTEEELLWACLFGFVDDLEDSDMDVVSTYLKKEHLGIAVAFAEAVRLK